MNTRRVPGVTRNSGWQAVDAEIVQARMLIQHQDETAASSRQLNRGAVGETRGGGPLPGNRCR